MKVSNRLCSAGLFLAAGLLVACSEAPVDTASPTDAVKNITAVTNSPLNDETALAAAQGDRLGWVSHIESSGLVDVSAIDTEVNRIRTDLIIDRYFESLYQEKIDDQAIEDYYREHKEDFTTENVEIAHILIRTPAASSAEERAAAATRAHELVSRLHTGEDFATLAGAESDDIETASHGGALGWVSQGQISDDVLQSALQLNAGEVSTPVVEKYGIHIIKKLSPTRSQAKPLNRVRARISQHLRKQVKQQAIEALTLATQ